ncbi:MULTISPECIES: cytosine permease [unclassified Streptomyces]|uniref:purine-cytosine permease family protein n=1 Tax=unclassified Streptomyces TaxID=2593676 RepID=UPI000DB9626D|nr:MULTISPECIES: cytosine permease [unclassified Streptomyces]MYT72043.1 cytosine permease [Streptomyces sp. SID8367]RAJ81453.1 NCS1 nucleoside transporter family [Streptomyces sp. PsTaAH-137]
MSRSPHVTDQSAPPEKLIAVEEHGADPVPPERRHGSPRQLLWTWASPQVGFATVFIGVLSVSAFGLSFWSAVAALVLGAGLGSLAHGVLSTDGPRFGVPQMVIGRLSFGFRGNALPSAVNAFVAGVGWFAVNTVGGAFALNSLTGLAPLPSLLILVVLEVVIGYVGHDLVHRFEKYAFPVLCAIFLLAGVWIFLDADLGASSGSGGGFGGFLLTFSACFGFTAGWNPCASDYARYLPESTSRRATAWYAGLGLFVSVSVVSVIGAASATLAAPAGASPTDAFTGQLPDWLGRLTLVAIILGAMAAATLNVYSAAVSLSSLDLKLPRWLNRAALVAVVGAIGTAAGWASLADAGHAFENFLLVIAYWIAPWLGVVLMEHALRALPDTALADRLQDRTFTQSAGLIALLAGVAVSVPLFSNQTLFVGWVPDRWPGVGDLTCPVGFVLGAGLYALLGRRDRSNSPV